MPRQIYYSIIEAEKSDILPEKDRLVYVDKSNICEGRGVFANTFLPEDSYVTAYPGKILNKKKSKKNNNWSKRKSSKISSDYVYEFIDGTKIDGNQKDPLRRWWISRGVGHLLNDVIDPCLYDNTINHNCTFEEVTIPLSVSGKRTTFQRADKLEKALYIKTTKNIKKDEELYIPYLLEYWLAKYKKNPYIFEKMENKSVSHWLYCHYYIECILRNILLFPCYLTDYLGLTTIEDNKGIAQYDLEFYNNYDILCLCDDEIGYCRKNKRWNITLQKDKKENNEKVFSGYFDIQCARCKTTVSSVYI